MQTTTQQHPQQAGPTLPPLRPHPTSQQQHHHHHHHHHHAHGHNSPYQSASPQPNSHYHHQHPVSQSPPVSQQYNQQASQESNPNWHNHNLKRTASRAELDRAKESSFTHSQPPPPLPSTRDSNGHSTSHQDESTFVKPECITPHLPPQPLPTTHSNHTSPQQPLSHPSSANHSPDQSQPNHHHPQEQPHNLRLTTTAHMKKRRMSIADQRSLLKPNQNHVRNGNSNLDNRHPTDGKSIPQSLAEPISPLVIGYNQPQHPAAIQQVAHTMKPPSHPAQDSRASPSCVPVSHAATRASLSKPIPSANNHGHMNGHGTSHNGLMKLLSHPSLSTSASTNQPLQQSAYEPPPPVVNLPSIDPQAARRPLSNRHHQPPQPLDSSVSSNHPNLSDPIPSPDMLDVSSPTQSSQAGPGSSMADRRGQAVRDKIKNMAFAPQTFRPQLLVQPSIKSAPIRNGFLQATAPNGEVVKTPLIARTNLASGGGNGSSNTSQAPEIHPARFTKFNPSNPSNLNQNPRLNHSIGPVPSTAYPKLSSSDGSYRQGVERRMTMHGGNLMQVPTLSHLMSGSSNGLSHSQLSPVSGRSFGKSANSTSHPTQSIPLTAPTNSIPSPYHNNNHHYQPQSQPQQLQHQLHLQDGPRNCGPGGPGTPSQPTFQDQPPPPGSARLRGSMGGPAQAPIPSRQLFLQLFESFYDSLSDSKTLQNNLEEQIRRSAQLLHSLQQSASVFESILDDRLGAVQTQSTRELQILENRIELLEARLASSSHHDEELHHHSLEMSEAAEKCPVVPTGSPKLPASNDSSAKSTSQTSTGGGPRSGTGVEEGHRIG
ncbi:hypothetical protein PCASD_01791 [Puccinia coronata f. sp. avenae]|uniref:Uncharacterized protein n=1 Tax=Puccinia coronata f. sp. avenae TaxID=200324 RepID=A0A2N5VJG2_9BASI|nr:hypothetical protein PCASD_01791 [Puccinia coronata f. sp. avenae]